jgi:molybdate transport system substrate-binding protein
MTRTLQVFLASALALGSLFLSSARADEVKVAVAANFTAAMKEIAAGFKRTTGHTALLSFGSTGKLYAQIIHGAPFAVFLAADQKRPKRLEDQGKASGRFTYATGRLVLWSAMPGFVDDEGKVLANGGFNRLAIANPKTAPYGAAALEILDRQGQSTELSSRLVRGDSIAQTHQFVATGSAELGFVALAQVVLNPEGSRWDVPQSFYTPVRQDAVLLENGAYQPAALALIEYLKGTEARAVIERFGYGIDEAPPRLAARTLSEAHRWPAHAGSRRLHR